MRTLLSFASVAAACALLALPAAATSGTSVRGVLAAVGAASVSVKDAKGIVTTCALRKGSPSLAGYSAGDRVQAVCLRTKGKLVLAKVRHLTTAPGASTNDVVQVKFGGTVTAVSSTSVSLHDGDRDLTCAVNSSSQRLDGVTVGQHLKVVCADGVLVSWSPVTSGDAAHVYEGTVTAVGSSSISVHASSQDVTCTLGDGSPSVTDVHVGDRVTIGCKVSSNQLVLLKRLGTGGTDQPDAKTLTGTITAISTAAITVHNSEHDLTCTLDSRSPSTAGFHLGDTVKVGCVNGALAGIAATDQHPADPPKKTTGALGTLTALSGTSLTVHTDGGSVTCSIGASSPSTSQLHVGDTVKMGCVDGVLAVVSRTDTTPPAEHHTASAAGVIAALSTASVTVHTDEHDLTCALGSASPSVAGFHVGDKVRIACLDSVLVTIARVDAPAPPTGSGDHHTVTIAGTLTALSSSSLTVRNTEHGGDVTVTCTLGSSSPSLGDYHVGDRVGVACTDGVLVKIVKITT